MYYTVYFTYTFMKRRKLPFLVVLIEIYVVHFLLMPVNSALKMYEKFQCVSAAYPAYDSCIIEKSS
jgi:hypothetical protein